MGLVAAKPPTSSRNGELSSEVSIARATGRQSLVGTIPLSADQHLSTAVRLLEEMGFREPAVWRIDGDAIEAALAVGDVARAEPLVARFEEQAARSRIPWSLAVSARSRGLLLAARGEPEAAAEAFVRALAEHEYSPVPFEHAQTLLVHGQVLSRLKQKRRARAALEQALLIFERLGAELWAARTQDELRRVVARSAPIDLSSTELRMRDSRPPGSRTRRSPQRSS